MADETPYRPITDAKDGVSVMSMYIMYVCLFVCLSVSVREDISGTTLAIFTKVLCMLPMSEVRSFSGTLTIGRIAYRREGDDGSAQRGEV